MPQMLSSSHLPHFVASASHHEEVNCNEEEETKENINNNSNNNLLNNDMDFFTDDYIPTSLTYSSPDTAAVARIEKDIYTKNILNIKENKINTEKPENKNSLINKEDALYNNKLIDCEVQLQLHNIAEYAHGGVFVIRIPQAIPVNIYSPNLSLLLSNKDFSNKQCVQKPCNEEENENEKIINDKGAAWEVRNHTLRIKSETSESEYSEAAAFSSLSISKENTSKGLLFQKESCPITHCKSPIINKEYLNNSICSNKNVNISTDKTSLVYNMHLPQNFVLSLRLPLEVEKKLVEICKENLINISEKSSLLSSTPSPPIWISSFLYTMNFRYNEISAPLLNLSNISLPWMIEESLAISTLEGLCIVALNVISQIGNRQQTSCNEDIDKTTAAQIKLLNNDSIFSINQEERIRRWLQRYMPLESNNNNTNNEEEEEEEERGKFMGKKSSLWPSEVSLVFYIALDLTRKFFPSLLLELESTILTALNPLLEERREESTDFKSSFSSILSSSLLFPLNRKNAIILLTQRSTSWWMWWQKNNNNDENNNLFYTSPVLVSKSYSAVRVIQYFTLIYPKFPIDEINSVKNEVEENEIIQFLLSAPALFKDLLIDREVIGVLDRAMKEIRLLYHKIINNNNNNNEYLSIMPPQVIYASMRCFILLICWLTFRPEGYSKSIAQTYFGSLLRLAVSLHDPREIGIIEKEENERLHFLLEICSLEYFSLASKLLRGIRERCGIRRRIGDNSKKKLRLNPWRQLCYGGKSVTSVNSIEDDCTTNTSHSRQSTIYSFISGNNNNSNNNNIPQISSSVSFPPVLNSNFDATNSDKFLSSNSIYFLRYVIRELRPILRFLEKDVFEGHDSSTTVSVTNNNSNNTNNIIIGTKRSREFITEEEQNTENKTKYIPYTLLNKPHGGPQLSVSSQFASHVFGYPNFNLWECSDSSGDDTTETFGSSSTESMDSSN